MYLGGKFEGCFFGEPFCPVLLEVVFDLFAALAESGGSPF
jgi:hypothetical protein